MISLNILIKNTKISFFWILIIFCTPVVMVNYIMTLRQGLATTIFIYVFFAISNRKIKNIIFLLLPLIHYSFYLVLLFYFISRIRLLQDVKKAKIYLRLVSFLSIIFSFFILNIVAFFSQVKMAEDYEKINESVIGFGLLFWVIILTLFLLEGKHFILKNIFEISILIFYVSSVTIFNPFSRILQTASILILISGFNLTGFRLTFFKFLMLLFVFYILLYFVINGRLGLMTLPINND
jgi:hypothetical protein